MRKHGAIYVSLFALGHSITMLLGGVFQRRYQQLHHRRHHWTVGGASTGCRPISAGRFQPNTKAATLIFGYCSLVYPGEDCGDISPDGLLPNLLARSAWVWKSASLLALAMILIVMSYWLKPMVFVTPL
jgi:hypothetical protein